MGELIYFGGREFDHMRSQYMSDVRKGTSPRVARRNIYTGINPIL